MSEGRSDVEKYMPPIADAIRKYIKWPSDQFTDIYNRAYEAVMMSIEESKSENAQLRAELAEAQAESAQLREAFTAANQDAMLLYNVVARMGRDDHEVDIGILCEDMDIVMKQHKERMKALKDAQKDGEE